VWSVTKREIERETKYIYIEREIVKKERDRVGVNDKKS